MYSPFQAATQIEFTAEKQKQGEGYPPRWDGELPGACDRAGRGKVPNDMSAALQPIPQVFVNVPLCEGCSGPVIGEYARFCDPCRAKRRAKPQKYKSNPRIDDLIREAYRQTATMPRSPRSALLAVKLGWPRWAVTRRACKLGLGRTKEKPWTEEELQLLERIAWMTPERIHTKFKAAGFSRTANGIALKLKRLRLKQNVPYYTASGLSEAFGVDSSTVLRWIKLGQMYARRKGEQTRPQVADTWMIHENDVYRFVRENPSAFDLRKVDQVWFMDLVFRGKVAQ